MTMRLFEKILETYCMNFLYLNFLGLPEELESFKDKKNYM